MERIDDGVPNGKCLGSGRLGLCLAKGTADGRALWWRFWTELGGRWLREVGQLFWEVMVKVDVFRMVGQLWNLIARTSTKILKMWKTILLRLGNKQLEL